MYILLLKAGDYMHTQIKKIGNSKGVIIPAGVLKALNIHESQELSLKVEGNEIILSKIDAFDPKSLDELFIGYTGEYQGEIIFDDFKGREVW